MRSGAIKRRVELWKKTSTKNEFGEYVEDWIFEKNLRAYRGAVRGYQTILNDEVIDLSWIRIVVRKQHSIEEQDRIVLADKPFQIEHIKPDETERWLTILCKRVND